MEQKSNKVSESIDEKKGLNIDLYDKICKINHCSVEDVALAFWMLRKSEFWPIIGSYVENYKDYELVKMVLNSLKPIIVDPEENLLDNGENFKGFYLLVEGSLKIVENYENREILSDSCQSKSKFHLTQNIIKKKSIYNSRGNSATGKKLLRPTSTDQSNTKLSIKTENVSTEFENDLIRNDNTLKSSQEINNQKGNNDYKVLKEQLKKQQDALNQTKGDKFKYLEFQTKDILLILCKYLIKINTLLNNHKFNSKIKKLDNISKRTRSQINTPRKKSNENLTNQNQTPNTSQKNKVNLASINYMVSQQRLTNANFFPQKTNEAMKETVTASNFYPLKINDVVRAKSLKKEGKNFNNNFLEKSKEVLESNKNITNDEMVNVKYSIRSQSSRKLSKGTRKLSQRNV